MNLKRRLERLREAQRQKSQASSVKSSAVAAPSVEECESYLPPSSESKSSLELLREELRLAIGRDARSCDTESVTTGAVAQSNLSLSDLPFHSIETKQGPLLQRRVVLGPEQCVGERVLGAAIAASSRALAELALDDHLAATNTAGWLFFDTETTGLGGASTLAFLVGMASLRADGCVVVEQLLLEEPEGEPALLARVSQCFAEATALVSFNGKAFDRPLLATRCVMNRQPELPVLPHLDLLHVGRRLHRERLGKCNLGRIEEYVLGFDRGPDIAGSEIAPIYGHFLRTGDARQVAAVVEHNYWDVLSMVALVGLYGEASSSLVLEDLPGLARTLRRAGAIEAATKTADLACSRGGGAAALRIRAQLAKARGDKRGATQGFEELAAAAEAACTGDGGAHLELAKLYEHSWKLPERALQWVGRGTSEDADQSAHRTQRLHRKIQRQGQPRRHRRG